MIIIILSILIAILIQTQTNTYDNNNDELCTPGATACLAASLELGVNYHCATVTLCTSCIMRLLYIVMCVYIYI